MKTQKQDVHDTRIHTVLISARLPETIDVAPDERKTIAYIIDHDPFLVDLLEGVRLRIQAHIPAAWEAIVTVSR